MLARSCDQLCPITADHIPSSATCQCPSMPHISAAFQCHPAVPVSATYQCQSVPPISAANHCYLSLQVSATYQCQSVPRQCCLSVPPNSASQCCLSV
ncbi:unnamed protein product, partial [Staurois parvus]